jgi:glucose-1-phosphate cytidylyltransferase
MRIIAMNKVIILAGGRGSRMGEHTDIIPKPMVEIGTIPIIQHIMFLWESRIGECQFYVAAGYKWAFIEKYFRNNPSVLVIYTGEETQTAGRLKVVMECLDAVGKPFYEPFYLSYGDGLTDFDLSQLRLNSDALVNILVVHPYGRFGEVTFGYNKKVTGFTEKPIDSRWINGGFFCCSPSILDYIQDESETLETDVFPRLMMDGALYCTPYDGYWHCMDTPKDWAELNEEYKNGKAKWL